MQIKNSLPIFQWNQLFSKLDIFLKSDNQIGLLEQCQIIHGFDTDHSSMRYIFNVDVMKCKFTIVSMQYIGDKQCHARSPNLLIQNVLRNERNTTNDWSYKFIVTALHQTWSCDMITESIKRMRLENHYDLKLESQEPWTKNWEPCNIKWLQQKMS